MNVVSLVATLVYWSPTTSLSSLLWICLSLEPFLQASVVWWATFRVNTRSMLTIFTVSCINCIVRMRDEHTDNVSLHTYVLYTHSHTYIHKYSDFLVCMIYVGLALAHPNYYRQWLKVWQPDLVGRARGLAEILRNFLRKRPRKKNCKSAEQCHDWTRDLQLHNQERYLQATRCRCCRYPKSQLYIDNTTNIYNIRNSCRPLVTNHTRTQ